MDLWAQAKAMNENEPKIGESWFTLPREDCLFLFIRKDKDTITQLCFKGFTITNYRFEDALFTYRYREMLKTDAL